jgi:hypothetical protein
VENGSELLNLTVIEHPEGPEGVFPFVGQLKVLSLLKVQTRLKLKSLKDFRSMYVGWILMPQDFVHDKETRKVFGCSILVVSFL